MSWTYDATQLATDPKTRIRFEVGDTDTTDQLLLDEEIALVLSLESTTSGAVAKCCEVLALRFARQADNRIGPLQVSASQRSIRYENLAKQFRNQDISMNAPSAAGIDESVTAVEVHESIFSIDMMNDGDNGDFPKEV